jgi:hypothetical protein
MMNAPAAVAALPFPLVSRQIIEDLGSESIPAALGGGALSWELSRIGYLEGLLIFVTGTVTVVTGSPAPLPGFPWNLLKRVVFDTPGLADPIALSGDSLHHQNLVARDFTLNRGGGDAPESPNALDDNAYYIANLHDLAPVAVAANAWRLKYFLPVRRNVGDMRGVVPLGNKQQSRLRITPAAAADIFGTTANFSTSALTIQVFQVFRTAPPAGLAAPDYEASHAVVIDEYEQSVSATGQVKVEIPTGGIILNVLHRVFLDDDVYPPAPEGSLDDVSLWINRDKVVDRVATKAFVFMQNAGRWQPLPAGTIVHDFDKHADRPYGIGGAERVEGWVFSDELNELTAWLGVASGTTLDNARIVTSVKRLVPIG